VHDTNGLATAPDHSDIGVGTALPDEELIDEIGEQPHGQDDEDDYDECSCSVAQHRRKHPAPSRSLALKHGTVGVGIARKGGLDWGSIWDEGSISASRAYTTARAAPFSSGPSPAPPEGAALR
jgi:hypothetical protein